MHAHHAEDGEDGAAASSTAARELQSGDSALHRFLQRIGFETASHSIQLPTAAGFNALLVAPLAFWVLCIAAGLALHDPPADRGKVYHNLMWFDRALLRTVGSIIPFMLWLIRAAVHRVASVFDSALHAPPHPAATLLTLSGSVYVLAVGVRNGTYALLVHLVHSAYISRDLMSDHIFLGGMIVACLQSECILVLSDLYRAASSGAPDAVSVRELGLAGTFVIAAVMYIFTAADMFYTTRYYHHPWDSFYTAVLVLLVFQLPLLLLMRSFWRQRVGQLAGGTAQRRLAA